MNVSRLTDLAVAALGWLAYAARRPLRGSTSALWAVVVGLVTISLIPTLAIGSSQRPTDLTFEDVRLQEIPANTTWVRLEGDLQKADGANVYHLRTASDTEHYVVVTALVALETGPVEMTGHLMFGSLGAEIIGFLDADVPAVPRRDEPFHLILVPAAIAIVLAIGMSLGYPVIRRDRRSGSSPARLSPGESIKVDWSGRIGRVTVADDVPIPSTISLTPDPDHPEISHLAIVADGGSWAFRLRRAAPTRAVRLCRVSGSTAGLEIHAQTADIVLAFPDQDSRDRLVATLS
jgi:hypothetical protein